jgi:hypothetical protein
MFFTTGKGRVAAILIAISFLAARGVFAFLHASSYYYATHVLTINGICAIVSGVVCLAYAYYLHKNPPEDDRVRLRDPKTGEFRPLEPISHDISGIPIELIGPLLIIVGIGTWLWEYFHPKF